MNMLSHTHTHTLDDKAGHKAYATHLKPYLARLLGAIGLDVTYHRAEGDRLYYYDAAGKERAVLDMLSGFGAGLFGNNHPELVACAQEVLASRRPMLAQASSRSYAGLLAQRLAELAEEATGHPYMVTLANSGAEAVEAAIKHASIVRQERIEHFLDEQKRTMRNIRTQMQRGELAVPSTLLDKMATQLNVSEISDLTALEFHLTEYNLHQLQREPFFLAIAGSFHGKSSGAVKLTYNPEFRTPWQNLGIRVHFVARNDVDALWQTMADAGTSCYRLVLDGNSTLSLQACTWSQIVGCFAEPIQGEGGIHELSIDFLQALRMVADHADAPLIFDEIQSGMGRTGTFFASSAAGVIGDYYLMSKALGGGMAKQAALLVRKEQYIERFGYLHTSTFAEDDYSAALGLVGLDLLTREDGALMRGCQVKGDYLLARLHRLQQAYPQVIRAVRGRGLIVGIELIPQLESTSSLLRVASEQNLLGFLISGYLLHEEAIRIAPTLSANNTIRLEPSALISKADLDVVCAALERTARAIDRADAHLLTRHMAGHVDVVAARQAEPDHSAQVKVVRPINRNITRRVACVAHFIHPHDLLHWDPSLAPLAPEECSQLLEKANDVLDPFLVDECVIEGPWGERVALGILGLPMTAAQLMGRVRNGDGKAVLAEIEAAVALAKGWGATQIGFAGYTSIVTNNCQALIEDAIGLTSGNSLTAAVALEATHQVADELGIDWGAACLGIVGGVGNIGRVLAEIEAKHVRSTLLLGRPGAEQRLHALAQLLQQDAHSAGIEVSTDLSTLRRCDVILSATNAPEPLIGAAHVGTQPVVICDVAVPGDAALDLAQQSANVRVIKGGIIQLPGDQKVTIRGMDLAQGEFFACVAEVTLLGLAGVREHFSYGPLRAARVQQIGSLAKQYGFTVKVRE